MATRVLYANHTSELAGAERQLLDLLGILGPTVEPLLACPPGELADEARARGVPVADVPDITMSLRPHPIYTARGIAQIARTARRLRELARDQRSDLVHVNTERAGLAAALAFHRSGPPRIQHAHTPLPPGRLGDTTANVLSRSAAVISNSRYTAEPLLSRGAAVTVAHNPIDAQHFDRSHIDRNAARADLGVPPDSPTLAIVGYLAPVKRQEDAIRALGAVRKRGVSACLVVAGSERFTDASAREDATAYARGLRELATELGIAGEVLFTGERTDIRGVLVAADVALIPSLSEGFGRVVLEAMSLSVPVIATQVGGPAEIVRDGIDGFLLPPRDPEAWAEVAASLLSDPDRRLTVGTRARERVVADFTPEAFRETVLSVYERVLEGGR